MTFFYIKFCSPIPRILFTIFFYLYFLTQFNIPYKKLLILKLLWCRFRKFYRFTNIFENILHGFGERNLIFVERFIVTMYLFFVAALLNTIKCVIQFHFRLINHLQKYICNVYYHIKDIQKRSPHSHYIHSFDFPYKYIHIMVKL